MSEKTNVLLERIKGLHGQIIENEVSHLNLIIEMGRALNELKKKSPRTWLKKVEQIGISQRVAQRYLSIGEHWSDEGKTPEADLRKELPTDLHKLDWLARLPLDKLHNLKEAFNLREESRGRVIGAVQRMLGTETGKPEAEKDLLEPLKKVLQNSVERVLEGAEDLDAQQRRQLAEEIETKLVDLIQVLQPGEEVSGQEPVADDSSGEE